MKNLMNNFCNDENGVIISAELVLVLTITVLGVIVGLSQVTTAVNTELLDIAHAIGNLNQSYTIPGYMGCKKHGEPISVTFGSVYTDGVDTCDCHTSCDMIAAGSPNNSQGG